MCLAPHLTRGQLRGLLVFRRRLTDFEDIFEDDASVRKLLNLWTLPAVRRPSSLRDGQVLTTLTSSGSFQVGEGTCAALFGARAFERFG